jgi:hypothetical protein
VSQLSETFKPLGHRLLATVIIGSQCAEIVPRPFKIREIVPGAVLDVGKPERLFIADLTHIDEELEVGVVMGSSAS